MSEQRRDRWCLFDPENRRKPPEYLADAVQNRPVTTEYVPIDAASSRD